MEGYTGRENEPMRVSTIREFRDNTNGYLDSKEPVLITRGGRVAGVFFPSPDSILGLDSKRQLFQALSTEIARQVKQRGISEQAVVDEFEAWRKVRRESRRRR